MKIVHIITSMKRGGAEKNLLKILKYSNKNKSYEKHIVISFSKKNDLEKEMIKYNAELIKIDFKYKFLFFLYFTKLYISLKKLKPDVVQCWMYHAIFLGGLSAKLTGVKNIIWNIRHSNYQYNKTKITTIIIIKLCAYLSNIIPNKIIYCSHNSQIFHSKIRYNKKKGFLIYNGYETDLFPINNRLKSKSHKRIIFGFIGRYNPQKNLNLYFKAISNFKKKYLGQYELYLFMYGKNIDYNNKILVKEIYNHNLSSIVKLKGFKVNITDAFKEIDFLGLSSSYGESFPNVLAEAMLSGIPCISTDVGEAKNIISKYGKIVKINDVNHFTKAIKDFYELFQNENEYIQISNSCIAHIEDTYSIANMYNNYKKLWVKNK
tara:strand:- start:11512 stop:12639 length:1128 start_codon:yes stop_codon:yes gene_type:complete